MKRSGFYLDFLCLCYLVSGRFEGCSFSGFLFSNWFFGREHESFGCELIELVHQWPLHSAQLTSSVAEKPGLDRQVHNNRKHPAADLFSYGERCIDCLLPRGEKVDI